MDASKLPVDVIMQSDMAWLLKKLLRMESEGEDFV